MKRIEEPLSKRIWQEKFGGQKIMVASFLVAMAFAIAIWFGDWIRACCFDAVGRAVMMIGWLGMVLGILAMGAGILISWGVRK